MQSGAVDGLDTVCALAAGDKANIGVNATAAARVCKQFCLMALLSFPVDFVRERAFRMCLAASFFCGGMRMRMAAVRRRCEYSRRFLRGRMTRVEFNHEA